MDDRILIVSAFGAAIVAYVLVVIGRRVAARRNVPRRMLDVLPAVEEWGLEIVHTAIRMAELEAQGVDLIGKVPSEYNSAILTALSAAKFIEQKSFSESSAMQLYGRRRFSEEASGSTQASYVVEPEKPLAPGDDSSKKVGDAPPAEAAKRSVRRWLGNVLLPPPRDP